MNSNKPCIKLSCILPLLAILISQPILSASYGKSYQPDNSEISYYSSSVNQEEMLPSEKTLNEIESNISITQPSIFLGDEEDPFDPGAETDDPNAHNDVPIGDGLNILLLLLICYAALGKIRSRKTKEKNIKTIK